MGPFREKGRVKYYKYIGNIVTITEGIFGNNLTMKDNQKGSKAYFFPLSAFELETLGKAHTERWRMHIFTALETSSLKT